MAKNKIMVRVKQLILIACMMGLWSCSNRMQQGRYYRYYVGNMKIEKPVLVEFEDQNDRWYVCPDSALCYCNDSNWTHRDDVFPYVSVVEIGVPMMTYFPRKQINHLAYFMYKYLPHYEYSKEHNYTIHHFYYELDMFECYMEATDIYMFDNLVDVDYDYLDYREPSDDYSKEKEFTYRLVVRDKYNIFQILRFIMKYPEPVLVEAID